MLEINEQNKYRIKTNHLLCYKKGCQMLEIKEQRNTKSKPIFDSWYLELPPGD